jgi:hypothetical protein
MGEKFNLKHEVLLAFTRISAIAVVGFACFIAIYYCSHIYYDREAALHDALVCSKSILEDGSVTSWITNGTLLGAVRLGRFVMWDGEIDIAVFHQLPIKHDDVADAVKLIEDRCLSYSSTLQGGLGRPRRWRLCTHRVCAEIHEFLLSSDGTQLTSIDGVVPLDQALPLTPCTVEGVLTSCPANNTFFLDAAYGPDWRSGSLTSLFY